jgi:hypothetical protein
MGKKVSRVFDDHPIISRKEARELGLKRYFTGQPCAQGHVAPFYTKGKHCVICSADSVLAYQKRMYAEQADEYRVKIRKMRAKNPAAVLFHGVRSRARTRGIEFTIVQADVVIPENCPCCSRKLQMRTGEFKQGASPESPSLDRFDPSKGYVPGNVEVICWRCNELKRNATPQELRTILEWMERGAPSRRLKLVG